MDMNDLIGFVGKTEKLAKNTTRRLPPLRVGRMLDFLGGSRADRAIALKGWVCLANGLWSFIIVEPLLRDRLTLSSQKIAPLNLNVI